MKKIVFTLVCACISIVLSSCKSIPAPESMYATSYMIGVSTGMILNETKIEGDKRNEIISIVNEVKMCIPEYGQSFKEAWSPIAERHVDKLIEEGKINRAEGALILSAFNTVTLGIDYLFDVRYPQAKQYKDLVEAAVQGFTSGLLETYIPVNDQTLFKGKNQYDKQAYDYLKNQNR